MILLRRHLRTLTWLALFALLGVSFAPTVSRALGVEYMPGMGAGMTPEPPPGMPADMPADMHAGMHHDSPGAEPGASTGHCGGTSLVHCALCCVGFAVAGLPPPPTVVFALRPQGAGIVPLRRADAVPRSQLRTLRQARAPPLQT